LEEEDIVKVTRWRKYWLFGEKVLDEDNNSNENNQNGKLGKNNETSPPLKRIRIKGWFPRQCAVELYDQQYEDQDQDQDYENESIQEKDTKKLN
jgi:palmitoyltransferase